MHGVIDRFEEDYSLIEVDGKITTIPRRLLPTEAWEGSAVVFRKGKWLIDRKATLQREQEINKFMDDLWK